MILAAVFLMGAIQRPLETLLRAGRGRLLLALFLGFLTLAAGLALVEMLNILLVFRAISTLGFYVVAFSCLAFLWLAFVIGERLRAHWHRRELAASRLAGLFHVVFPSPLIWLGIICFGLFVTLSFLSSSMGGRWATRDLADSGHLPIVTIVSAAPLSISGGTPLDEGGWRYDNLRLVIKTDDTYYVLRPAEVRDGVARTYGIPQSRVAEMQVIPWYDRRVHPGLSDVPRPG